MGSDSEVSQSTLQKLTQLRQPLLHVHKTLLDLEREAFLKLVSMRKTQDRIAHMLKTGKPLRN